MTRATAVEVLDAALAETGLPVERPDPHTFVVTMEGERKLRTTVSLCVGDHSLSINAFVARRPDESAEAVYRWLLERNRRMYAVAFCIDHLGDIYLSLRSSLAGCCHAGRGRPDPRLRRGILRRLLQHDPRTWVRHRNPPRVEVAHRAR